MPTERSSSDTHTGSEDVIERSRYLTWMHGVSVVLAVAALAVTDLSSPSIGFPLAVIVLTALGIPS